MSKANPKEESEFSNSSLEQVKEYLLNSKQPVFYVSRSATNLLGVQRFVSGLNFISLVDSWTDRPDWAFSPVKKTYLEPRGNVNIANWLLLNKEVQKFIAKKTPEGLTPKIVIAMFDEKTEKICKKLGYELAMPSINLRSHVDSKIETTLIGNSVGIASAPNIITKVSGWQDLIDQANLANLGNQLVIQTAYGDSGHTTYFINSKKDFDSCSRYLIGKQIKVMKQISHLPLSVEAVILETGTVIGPIMLEVTGHAELTKFKGGWAGSELFPGLLSIPEVESANALVSKFANVLKEKGYRGTFEISILLDSYTREIFLGELNPRITGSAPISNLAICGNLPLFTYHILEFAGKADLISQSKVQLNQDNSPEAEVWSTIIVPSTNFAAAELVQVSESARYKITNEKTLEKISEESDWERLCSDDEIYFLRTVNHGEIISPGAALGIALTRFRVQDTNLELTEQAKFLISAIQQAHTYKELQWFERIIRNLIYKFFGILKR